MIKFFVYGAILLCFLSCGYRTLEGRAKPVYFSADSAIFTDTLYPVQTVWYTILRDLQGFVSQEVELKQGEVTKGFIHGPTYFAKGDDKALIYPRESVVVSGEFGDYTFSIMNGSLRRNRELLFFKTFHKMEKYPAVPRLPKYTLQIILDLEKEQKNAILKAEAASQQLFDSLIKAYSVSKKFKKLTVDYVKNRYDLSLNWVYKLYKDTLAAHDLYLEKFRQLIPAINAITEKSNFNANIRQYLNDLIIELFPGNRMWSLPGEEGFRACFDSVENNFTGFARDYLLSRIMYRAFAIGLKVPNEYLEKYKRYSIDKAYRKIVYNTKKERQQNETDTKGGRNIVLAADGKTKFDLDKVLALHKGKLVFIDLWASWCGPCLKEIPYLKQLMEKYSTDKIVFLAISLDKQTPSWHTAMLKLSLQTSASYLLLNAAKTSFYKQFNINTIPRYLLFDKEGKLINADAPSPSSPALRNLLDEVVFK